RRESAESTRQGYFGRGTAVPFLRLLRSSWLRLSLNFSHSGLGPDRAANVGSSNHMPAMAYADRLAGKRVGFERSEKECHLGNVVQRGELLVHRLAEQDFFDDTLLGDSQLFGLLGNLLLDERGQNEAGTDDVGTHIVMRAFLGHHAGKTKQPVLCGDIRRLER